MSRGIWTRWWEGVEDGYGAPKLHMKACCDVDGFYGTRFFTLAVAGGDRQEVRELLERSEPALLNRGLDPSNRGRGIHAELVPIALDSRICRSNGTHPVWQLDPSTIGDWSEAPLRVLLENDHDWILVEVAMRVYERPRLRHAMARDHLRRDQRGGKGEVKKAIETCRPIERIFVLMDSDKVSLNSAEGAEQQEIRTLATTRPNIHVFILAKREVENYLPESVWSSTTGRPWPGSAPKQDDLIARRKILRRWQRLSDEEKDFLDLETYFPDAKKHVDKLQDAMLVPDASMLESRDTKKELSTLLDQLEAWL